jgi:type VI secretion system protein ImpE
MTPQELYEAGKLREAIDAGTEAVRRAPTDAGQRWLLCELLCFAGDFERADRQLDALGHQNPEILTTAAVIRQLIRAEEARQQFFTDGRVPEMLGVPPAWMRLQLEASIHVREKRPAEAMRLLGDAEEQRPHLKGSCDGQDFDDFRDMDDVIGCVFEVLTSTGKYYWIPADRVEVVEFRPYERPHDLLWRRAHMIVRDGPDGEVFLPALYAGAAHETDDRLRLGRMTEWRGAEGEPIRGVGQRTYWFGGEEKPILEITTVTIREA